jgi:membrane protease YdiL (CAAX protease family)
LAGYAVLLLAWVVVVFWGAQWVVANLALWVFGREALVTTVGTALLSAVAYTVAAGLIIGGPVMAVVTVKKDGKKRRWGLDLATNRNELGLTGLPTWTDLGLGVAGIIVYFIIGGALMTVLTQVPWFDAQQAQEIGFNKFLQGPELALAFVSLVVVAPVAEELIFRGWLYGKLRNRLTGKVGIVVAMLLVSVLFGVLHGQWNVGVMVFVLSLVMCGIREMTGTIWGGMIVHMLKNAIACYAIFVLGIG